MENIKRNYDSKLKIDIKLKEVFFLKYKGKWVESF